MNADAQIARWQRKLDHEFPQGALAAWDDPSRPDASSYLVTRPEVTGMQGLDPVIRFPVLGPDKVLGPLRCLSWTETQTEPVRVVGLTLEGSRPLFLSTGLGKQQVADIAPERAELKARAPLGGPRTMEAA